jgi:hypothetical protein
MKEVFNQFSHRFWLFALVMCLLAIYQPAAAQTTTPKSESVSAPDDRSSVRVRYPSPEKIRDYQNDRDYQYNNEAPPPENPVGRFFYWLYSKFINFLTSKSYRSVWQYVVLACIAALTIYLLMKAEVLGALFPRKAATNSLDYENLSENIHEINFEQAIEEAIYQRNFRLGVRLLYLQTLKQLADSGQIAYRPEKTNRQYVYELINRPYQSDFERLTRQFEFVWYGDFPIDENQFTQIKNAFSAFTLNAQPNLSTFKQ